MTLKSRDLGLILLLALGLGLIGLRIASLPGAGGEGANSGGWRIIDLETLQRRIEQGELSDREADWYRTEPHDDG